VGAEDRDVVGGRRPPDEAGDLFIFPGGHLTSSLKPRS
jgi:hypothetical protein